MTEPEEDDLAFARGCMNAILAMGLVGCIGIVLWHLGRALIGY